MVVVADFFFVEVSPSFRSVHGSRNTVLRRSVTLKVNSTGVHRSRSRRRKRGRQVGQVREVIGETTGVRKREGEREREKLVYFIVRADAHERRVPSVTTPSRLV